MKWRIGDRVLVCGKHPGVIVDSYKNFYGQVTYAVRFDDAIYALIPPQTAIGCREEDLTPESLDIGA